MTCLQKQDIKERVLPKSSNKQKSSTTKKKAIDKCNNTNMVTLEMHSKLKSTINKIDDEVTQFPKRYEQEQAKFTTEISKIVETLITPIRNKNIKLKEKLNDANLKFEQLRRQVLDITTQNGNKLKESKNWILGELGTINNSITALDNGLKGLTSLQTKAKTEKSTKQQ